MPLPLPWGVESSVFHLMARSSSLTKVQNIAAALDVDPALLARSMRHISAMGYVKEIGPDEYEVTSFSRAYHPNCWRRVPLHVSESSLDTTSMYVC